MWVGLMPLRKKCISNTTVHFAVFCILYMAHAHFPKTINLSVLRACMTSPSVQIRITYKNPPLPII